MSSTTPRKRTKQKPRTSERRPELPSAFKPRLLKEADQRFYLVRELKRRFEELVEHSNADSAQKRMLCERAVFLAIVLETEETKAAQGEAIDVGKYAQACNALKGLLKDLGLEKAEPKATDLTSYLRNAK